MYRRAIFRAWFQKTRVLVNTEERKTSLKYPGMREPVMRFEEATGIRRRTLSHKQQVQDLLIFDDGDEIGTYGGTHGGRPARTSNNDSTLRRHDHGTITSFRLNR